MNKVLFAALLLAVSSSASAGKLILDEFNTPNPGGAIELTGPAGDTADTTASDAGIIGGERETRLTIIDNQGTPDTSGAIKADVNLADGDALSWGNDPGVSSWFELVYDGVGGAKNDSAKYTGDDGLPANVDTDGLGGEDLSGYDSLFVDVATNDAAGGFEFFVSIWDTLGNFEIFEAVNIGTTGIVIFPYALFPSIDFSTVGAIALGIRALDPEMDVTFNNFGVIPEPSILVVFGAGLLMLGGLGYRRRNQ